MIDIHNHIVPGIDDGSPSLEESLQMAVCAAKEGIHTIIATPHHANGKYENTREEVEQKVRKLNEALSAENIPVTVLPGQEVRINRELLDDIGAGRSGALHQSSYMLIELPSGHVPSYIEEMLHELKVLSYVPIIAHPERNSELAASMDQLIRLIEAGALTQLTSHSINGAYGSKLQKLCFDWCKNGLVHFVATDAHNMTHRAFGLKQAYTLIAERVGEETALLYKANAERLLRNEPIEARIPVLPGKSWWKFW